MSAFVGYVRLDGAGASETVARTMLDRLRHRVDAAGWDARFVQTRGAVALGSAVLDATPEAAFEREHPTDALSLQTPDGKMLLLAGDVRLDGRSALAAELGLDTTKAAVWSDGRLALEAYSRWGEEAPVHLSGDFAFAVWDEAHQSLFCARDRFGVRPFYFAFVPGVVFAFANEIKALWPALPFAPRPDEAHIGDYLAGEFLSFTRTFYEGVERLPPAHCLVLDAQSSDAPRGWRYFALDASRELELPRDDDYAQAVKTHVRARRRRAEPHGGGIVRFFVGWVGLFLGRGGRVAPNAARKGADCRAFDGV